MKKILIRFPNESFFDEIYIDMNKFIPNKEFNNEIFGWYEDIYISIKNDR